MEYPDHFTIPPETPVAVRLDILERLVQRGSCNTRVRDLSKSLCEGRSDKLEALLEGLHARVAYTLDPDEGQGEEFQRAEYTLSRGAGDCEDMSVLFASMARAVGIPARAVWMETEESEPMNHVPAQACLPVQPAASGVRYAVKVSASGYSPSCADPSGWTWVETTVPGARIGEHPYAAAARLGASR